MLSVQAGAEKGPGLVTGHRAGIHPWMDITGH